jgi:CRP-like cAMP-binding protein
MYSEETLLASLPKPLRTKLRSAEAIHLLEKNPIFNSSFFPKTLQDNIASKLVAEWHRPHSDICTEGDIPNFIWFCRSGEVDILHAGKIIGGVLPGSYFGEQGVIHKKLQPLSYKTRSSVMLFRLSKEDYEDLIKFYPDVQEIMLLVAGQKMKKLNLVNWMENKDSQQQEQDHRIKQLETLFEEKINTYK